MIPDPERDPDREEPLPFTPGFAVLLVMGASFLQLLVLVMLAGSDGTVSPARIGIATIVGYGAALALAAARLPPPPGAALGFAAPLPRSWWAALLLLPSILLISEIDNVLRSVSPPEAPSEPTPPTAGLALVEQAVVLIAVLPVIEEIFFRGLLQPRLVETLHRPWGVLSAALLAGVSSFALWSLPVLVVRFAGSLLLGVLRESSGSVLPGLGLNIAFGACAWLATLGAFGIPGFDDTSAPHTPLGWLLPAAVFTGVGLRLCQSLLTARPTVSPQP